MYLILNCVTYLYYLYYVDRKSSVNTKVISIILTVTISPYPLYSFSGTTMKVLLVITVLVALTLADQSTLQKFNDFKLKYKKAYRNINEEVERFDIFKANLAEIDAPNNGRSSYKKGINQFTDLTKEEFKETYLGLKTFPSGLSSAEKMVKQARNSSRELPDSVNWVEEGAVTGVKNQGACGSCWAFSLTSQVESYNYLATGQLVELSTQQVTSCTPNTLSCGGTGGCRGSVTQLGFNYLQLFGAVTDADWPYVSGSTGDGGECMYDLEKMTPVVGMTGYNSLTPNDEDAIMHHIAEVGPLAIAADASNWGSYQVCISMYDVCCICISGIPGGSLRWLQL